MKTPRRRLMTVSITLAISLLSAGISFAQETPEAPGSAPVSTEAQVLIQLASDGKEKLLLDIIGPASDVNVSNKAGVTPLHAAAEHGHNNIVKALLERGADIKRRDTRGATPMLSAAKAGHADTVALLLDAGASLRAEDEEGANAMIHAAYEGHFRRLFKRTTGLTPGSCRKRFRIPDFTVSPCRKRD